MARQDKTSAKKPEEAEPDMRARAHERVDELMDRKEMMQARASEAYANVRARAQEVRTKFDDYVSENPERSVMIAAGVGVAAGFILGAMMMRGRGKGEA